MLTHEFLDRDGILIVCPSEALTAADFEALAADVDPKIERRDGLAGLLIDAPTFPGWDGMAGLVAHLKFVKGHHRSIRRVAAVTSSSFLTIAPRLLRHFVSADIRRFTPEERQEALDWLRAGRGRQPEATIRFLETGDHDVLWIRVSGKVTREDYARMLPALEERVAEGGKISCLVELGDFQGIELGAAWEDMKFGLRHMDSFARIAVVGDQGWVDWSSRMADPMTKVEIKAFREDELDEAWGWVTPAD